MHRRAASFSDVAVGDSIAGSIASGIDLALPLPAVVVEGGTVLAANDEAQRLAPGAAVGSALAAWFHDGDGNAVQEALVRGTSKQPLVVRRRGGDGWVAIHASGTVDGAPQVVLLRDATDDRFVRAAVDEVADSTFVLDATGGGRWRSERLRARSSMTDEAAATTPAGERVHPEDLPVVFEAFAAATPEQPATVVARSRAVDDDDRWEWIELTVFHRLAHEVLQGYLVQVRNLDEGRTIATALSHADPELLSLTEAAPVGIAVTDPAGQIVYRNPAARSLLGPDLATFGGTDWLSLARSEHRTTLAGAFEAALRRGEERITIAAFDAPGDRPRWLRLRFTAQRSTTDQPMGVIATVEDVTEQVEARTELKAAEARMRHLATHDPLTGLPNRAALTDELGRAARRHQRSANGLAILFCDLDDFKPINDRLGHAAGDTVLVEVASRLRSAVRETDFVARLGGDEFVVLCESVGDGTTLIEELAARLHDHVEAPVTVEGTHVAVGVSVGVGLVPAGAALSPDALLLLADAAMYEAKSAGVGGTSIRWGPMADSLSDAG